MEHNKDSVATKVNNKTVYPEFQPLVSIIQTLFFHSLLPRTRCSGGSLENFYLSVRIRPVPTAPFHQSFFWEENENKLGEAAVIILSFHFGLSLAPYGEGALLFAMWRFLHGRLVSITSRSRSFGL